jgi:hypothetical protein
VNAHPSKGVRIYASPEVYIVVIVVSKGLGSRPVSKEDTRIGLVGAEIFALVDRQENTGKNRDELSLRLLCRCP